MLELFDVATGRHGKHPISGTGTEFALDVCSDKTSFRTISTFDSMGVLVIRLMKFDEVHKSFPCRSPLLSHGQPGELVAGKTSVSEYCEERMINIAQKRIYIRGNFGGGRTLS